jgi:mRNA-degrading endonuclease RelE of RelBE toxin-antitoxin system
VKELYYTDRFRKLYKKLSPPQKEKLNRQLKQLALDINHPSLKVRKMINHQDVYEARVDIHYRFTFTMLPDRIILRAVGTHEIYRKP